ncbi:MAG TPA: primosomal replication protein N [Burkholderiaceae bacterium]|nr:primosomal replication protein N [Burkholderiaceae bacterium]
MNRVQLTASVVELQPLRYTPAGVPALELILAHESEVQEAGQKRRVSFETRAIALGDTAHLLADTPLGGRLELEGFLAATRLGSGRLVLHIQKAVRGFPESGSIVV